MNQFAKIELMRPLSRSTLWSVLWLLFSPEEQKGKSWLSFKTIVVLLPHKSYFQHIIALPWWSKCPIRPSGSLQFLIKRLNTIAKHLIESHKGPLGCFESSHSIQYALGCLSACVMCTHHKIAISIYNFTKWLSSGHKAWILGSIYHELYKYGLFVFAW